MAIAFERRSAVEASRTATNGRMTGKVERKTSRKTARAPFQSSARRRGRFGEAVRPLAAVDAARQAYQHQRQYPRTAAHGFPQAGIVDGLSAL